MESVEIASPANTNQIKNPQNLKRTEFNIPTISITERTNECREQKQMMGAGGSVCP